MKTRLMLMLGLVLIAVPSLAQKVYVDFDKDAAWDTYETFAFVSTGEDLSDTAPLVHNRVIEGIRKRMVAGGMKEDNSAPQLLVTYHTAEREETAIHTSNFGYGYGPGWGWDPYWGGGMGTSTTQVVNYTKGTLLIDVWEREAKRLIWRGSATATVTDNPKKGEKQIEKALDKLVKEWEKKQKKMQ